MSYANITKSKQPYKDLKFNSLFAGQYDQDDIVVSGEIVAGRISMNTMQSTGTSLVINDIINIDKLAYMQDYGASTSVTVTTPAGLIQFTNVPSIASLAQITLTVNYAEFSPNGNDNTVLVGNSDGGTGNRHTLLNFAPRDRNVGQFTIAVGNSSSLAYTAGLVSFVYQTT